MLETDRPKTCFVWPKQTSLSKVQLTWRFMGSYRWGYKSPNRVTSIATLLITLLITTHEPPSREMLQSIACYPQRTRKDDNEGHTLVEVTQRTQRLEDQSQWLGWQYLRCMASMAHEDSIEICAWHCMLALPMALASAWALGELMDCSWAPCGQLNPMLNAEMRLRKLVHWIRSGYIATAPVLILKALV